MPPPPARPGSGLRALARRIPSRAVPFGETRLAKATGILGPVRAGCAALVRYRFLVKPGWASWPCPPVFPGGSAKSTLAPHVKVLRPLPPPHMEAAETAPSPVSGTGHERHRTWTGTTPGPPDLPPPIVRRDFAMTKGCEENSAGKRGVDKIFVGPRTGPTTKPGSLTPRRARSRRRRRRVFPPAARSHGRGGRCG